MDFKLRRGSVVREQYWSELNFRRVPDKEYDWVGKLITISSYVVGMGWYTF